MVSVDSPERNRDFARAHGGGVVVLSDPAKETARAYGVLAESGTVARRWTFYIDSAGTIRQVDRDVSAGSHGPDIARQLGELGFPRARGRC